jgi:polysaccharide export outer membrane protein
VPASNPEEYRLGVRDVIEITVFGHDDLSRIEEVPPMGVVDFPLIGALELEGRTVDAIQSEITRRLGEDYLVNPNVSVRVTEHQSQWVNVVGYVEKPGKFYLKGASTLIDMITEAGGLSEAAGNEIVITREENGQVRQIHIHRDDLFSEDNEEFNVALRMGDVVEVGEQDKFYIQGEVAEPGSFPLERGYTLMKAITVAGGFTQWADRKEVELLRDEEGGPQKMKVNLKAIGARKQPDVELKPDDIIIVKRRLL